MDTGLLARMGNPTTPANEYEVFDREIAGPEMIDHEAMFKLTTFAEDDAFEQAMCHATQASKTNMSSAVPTQNYVIDTRPSAWSLSGSGGYQESGTLRCQLAASQVIDLSTTRITFKCRITVGDTKDAGLTVPSFFPHQVFVQGLKGGSNGMTLQDIGTTEDQPWLVPMIYFSRPSDKKTLFTVADTAGLPASPNWFGPYVGGVASHGDWREDCPLVLDPAATGNTVTYDLTFIISPSHALFRVQKLWPPVVPLELTLQWSRQSIMKLLGIAGGVDKKQSYKVEIMVDSIRSQAVELSPAVKDYVLAPFSTSQSSNINTNYQYASDDQKVKSILDNSFGINNYNPDSVAAIYQYPTWRMFTATINGTIFDVSPITNGSARPTLMIITFDNPRVDKTKGGGCAPAIGSISTTTDANALSFLSELQILYDGQTIWDMPQDKLGLYQSTLDSVGAGGAGTPDYVSYPTWLISSGYIAIRTAPSHNPNDVQPARSTTLIIRGRFGSAVGNTNIRVGMFYDQTCVVSKKNGITLSLPIQ